MTRVHVLAATACVGLAGCATPPPPPPAPAPASIVRLYEQPAERELMNGLRFYEEGQHERAEALLRRALSDGLRSPYDVAIANKYLAFIACAYNRPAECESSFRAAFAADPAFRLADSEVGHPLWGPVYKRVAAEEAAKAGSGR